MVTSTFDLFKVGIGPSSSHTMGPMTAAADFARRVGDSAAQVEVWLYGSLALTGKGHATDRALALGLAGHLPGNIDPDVADSFMENLRATGQLQLNGQHTIAFDEHLHLHFCQRERLNYHTNALTFAAFARSGAEILRRTYYSIGGGAVLDEDDILRNALPTNGYDGPHEWHSGAEMLELAASSGRTIADLMRENEEARLSPAQVVDRLATIRRTMAACIDRGIASELAELPGGLRVKRRAPAIYKILLTQQQRAQSYPLETSDPLSVIDWINLWALAVNEENAAGGKVVTAPTNGAAGIVPAVLRYYERFVPGATERGAEDFLLTAAAIGSLFKENASISGAEVGCQGEIGVACSMAAAGLAAALGATPGQIENAAEIGMEHNLGLTCDPVAGLVQVPCIERNAVGSIKAIEAVRLAMLGDGTHRVSLDQVIETMRRTGLDMSERYKETSLGGLAVNVVEC